MRVHALLLALFLLACNGKPPDVVTPPQPSATADDGPKFPAGRLPGDVRPTHYDLELSIDPRKPSFSGKVSIDIELDAERDTIWLHGIFDELEGTVSVGDETIAVKAVQHLPEGVLELRPAKAIPKGKATIALSFTGKFGTHLDGLYRVESAGESYAFTQMEPIWTRRALPCFDEPAFKTPFDVTLVVPKQDRAIANTQELQRSEEGETTRIRFATTEPLPSYLLAWAVGPLDIVEAPPIPANEARAKPIPFRGVAAKGRGKELAYALEHTPALLKILEDYFGTGYPYDKLDIIAVPDKGGAMENVGAITFREWLLLLDEKTASIDQKRAFAAVMAHELAHMWFGNLVTMPWWDDIWLNEAFATWMGGRVVELWRPEHQSSIGQLDGIHGAMNIDRLVHARQIRQPVEKNDDIHNAFDRITYRKGGGVLGMFERWMGPDVFRKGLQLYMAKHRHGSATADDLLASFSAAAERDVGTPFRTFLLQPGLPQIAVRVMCNASAAPALELSQSRYLPLGSTGNRNAQTWQVPVCVRYGHGPEGETVAETCVLMTEKKQSIELEGRGCPAWVMPNAGAAGYYLWSLEAKALRKLATTGLPQLSVREKMSLAHNIWSAYADGSLGADEAFVALGPLAQDPHPKVAVGPMILFREARRYLDRDDLRKKVEAVAGALYTPALEQVGYEAKPGDDPEALLRRRAVLQFLALSAKHPEVRDRMHTMGRAYLGLDGDGKIHLEAVEANIAGIAAAVVGERADGATFDKLLALLEQTRDEDVRRKLLAALGSARDPSIARRARQLVLDKRLKVNEVMHPLWIQLGDLETRDATWNWFKSSIDMVIDRMSPRRAGGLPEVMTAYCDRAHAADAQLLFESRIKDLAGGTRNLDLALERTQLCAARKDKQLESMRAFFERQ